MGQPPLQRLPLLLGLLAALVGGAIVLSGILTQRQAPVAALAADPAPSDGAEPSDGSSTPSDASAASDGASAASSTPSTHVYVVLIDWQRLLAAAGIRSIRLGIGRTDGPHPRGSLIPNIVAGTVLLAGNAWYGIRGDNYGWPFACYPKFAYPIREPVRSVIELDIVDPDGRVVTESFATGRGPLRTARWIGVVSRVLKLPDGPQRDAALEELARLAVGDRPAGTELRFHRARYSTRPQDRDEPPITRVLLATSVTAPTTSATDQGQIEPASSTQ